MVTIGAGASVREATTLMREREIRHLPALDAAKRLVGIVTDRDLRQVVLDVAIGRVGEDTERLGDLGGREVMTWGVVTVTPATDLREAARVIGIVRNFGRPGQAPLMHPQRSAAARAEHRGRTFRVMR